LVDGKYGDHYKWRAMRANGVSEDYITGNKSDREKFRKWAEVLPYTIGNPLYLWAHMELKMFFGIEECLSVANADKIYDECNEKLKTLTARKMIEMAKVKVLCTTDDPVDPLEWHMLLKQDKSFNVNVLPAFRPDKAINIELQEFLPWIQKLEKASSQKISNINDLMSALRKRIEYFNSVGCKISDHALDEVMYLPTSSDEVNAILIKKLGNNDLTHEEIEKYHGFILIFLGKEYARLNWAQQYHLNAKRNNSSRMMKLVGPDTGFDSINDYSFVPKLSQILDILDSTNELPKTILYSLNPKDNEAIATICNCFNDGFTKSKMQYGSAWWFNDQKDGMEEQIKTLCNMGLISNFIGMLTDSRSFLSYPRHDYFRRILCNIFGNFIENGEYPNDIPFVGQIIQNICFQNAWNYFNVGERE
jgi:glucuronate isomerase